QKRPLARPRLARLRSPLTPSADERGEVVRPARLRVGRSVPHVSVSESREILLSDPAKAHIRLNRSLGIEALEHGTHQLLNILGIPECLHARVKHTDVPIPELPSKDSR